MRKLFIGAALALVAATPAQSELWYFDFSVFATGTYAYSDCDFVSGCSTSVTPVTAHSQFQHFPGVAPFQTSTTVSFSRIGSLFGFTDRDFFYSATLQWVTALDGSRGIQGTNFVYSGQGCSGFGGGCSLPYPDSSHTSLTAATFAVGARQGAPGPVPEPATWAMILMGFAAIGVSMRRRRNAVPTAQLGQSLTTHPILF